jgi:hypothetical protein
MDRDRTDVTAQLAAARRSLLLRSILYGTAAVALTAAALLIFSSKTSARERALVTVETAAGPVTVAPEFAGKIVPFIEAVVALTGEKPTRIKCYSRAASHVPGSLHFSGRACDFAQSGWGRTSYKVMYRIAALARAYGLRDGCEFRDWGHIDDGPHLPPARTHGCKSGPFVAWSQINAAAVP